MSVAANMMFPKRAVLIAGPHYPGPALGNKFHAGFAVEGQVALLGVTKEVVICLVAEGTCRHNVLRVVPLGVGSG